jgi:hypothetical protein
VNKIFLIGGYDLEMIEIKKLLDDNNIQYIDYKLKWGARLSDYKDKLQDYKDIDFTIYGIELEKDIAPPPNYIEIDHHGKNDNKPSSLEQVADILGIKLSKEQELIAANDSSYITGMKSLCATEEEIKEIRQRERDILDITKEDEDLAKKSVDESKDETIYAYTDKFTAISDMLYDKFNSYMIYNDIKAVFYGYKKDKILKFLDDEKVVENHRYYGGGDFGFVGIKDKVLEKEKIELLVFKIKKLNIEDRTYSYHTFMFPFKFDLIKEKTDDFQEYCKKFKIDERNIIDEELKELLDKDGWEYKPFYISADKYNYNEYAYFHPFVRRVFYNTKDFEKGQTSYFFNKFDEKDKSGTFEIATKKYGKYELQLEGISLRLFETGIGILTIEGANKKVFQSDIDSILHINEFGRRIYLLFLGNYKDGHNLSEAAKDSQIPTSIKVTLPDGKIYEDNFCDEYKKVPNDIKISKYIMEILGNNTFSSTPTNDKYYIQPVLDDRMYVISWYNNEHFSNSLSNDNYLTTPKWYEYVFVDGDGITVHNDEMQQKLIKNSTYSRWMNKKDGTTLFGMSRYSFVATSGGWYGANILLPHMKTMYYQMVTLLLAVRSSILKYSDEATILSNLEDENSNLRDRVTGLYKNYIKFINKLYFREITAQEQGIELYNQASQIMNIHSDIKDLDKEIEELHSYVDLCEEKDRNDRLEFISKIGAVFLPPTLMAGLFGMNIITFDETLKNELMGMGLIVSSGIIGYLFTKKNKVNSFFIIILLVLMPLYYYFSDKKDDVINQNINSPVTKHEKSTQSSEKIIKSKKENHE